MQYVSAPEYFPLRAGEAGQSAQRSTWEGSTFRGKKAESALGFPLPSFFCRQEGVKPPGAGAIPTRDTCWRVDQAFRIEATAHGTTLRSGHVVNNSPTTPPSISHDRHRLSRGRCGAPSRSCGALGEGRSRLPSLHGVCKIFCEISSYMTGILSPPLIFLGSKAHGMLGRTPP